MPRCATGRPCTQAPWRWRMSWAASSALPISQRRCAHLPQTEASLEDARQLIEGFVRLRSSRARRNLLYLLNQSNTLELKVTMLNHQAVY